MCPSKINLFLRVERRRPDGFHDLASLFQVVSWGDDMEFEPLGSSAGADVLTCNMLDVPTDSSNLAIKALDLFRRKTGSRERYRVGLRKRVPHGAGLGGGSGNAATALWAANQLAGRPAADDDLLAWSGEIGSDISVFFGSGCSYCTGRGEVVQDVRPVPLSTNTPLLLVKPPAGLPTPAVFKRLDLERCSREDPLRLLQGLQGLRRASAALCVNDLQAPAFQLLEELAEIKGRLEGSGAFDAVFMSGSGSTVVGVGSDAVPDSIAAWRQDLFLAPARPVLREEGAWYAAPAPELLRELGVSAVAQPVGGI
ncbi:hypothetical protein APUTEX25_000917 [Auxenochlorella protothecoides]|uniref:4-(cytidine 5'-diphospho)-2-C-methyl-D-erythritol kinase n=1 Tax=Auxenochlorella protothecoides TaxID=3075 RepID=A0A3M7KQI4_AUXPR|nr:hypothetical protein APUTEX25_000917 [Auxenochlorella protothecoides]|eukprot:RMZ52798.1 hypothetical protein APUTEX25_000917 [Auxenochlorella protothecoides]